MQQNQQLKRAYPLPHIISSPVKIPMGLRLFENGYLTLTYVSNENKWKLRCPRNA